MTNWNRRSLLRVAGQSAGAVALGLGGGYGLDAWAADPPSDAPDQVLNPVEVSGPAAVPVVGRLPGEQRMYVLPAGKGEYHRVGGFAMTRIARPLDTGSTYEIMSFAGRSGAAMPRHLHRGSHVALLVMGGDVELELDGKKWRMLRGDFANIPPGTPHGWTMRSDRSQITIFAMGDRTGKAFVAMGAAAASDAIGSPDPVSPGNLADAALAGDFMRVATPAPNGEAVRVSNLVLPQTPGPYVLLDGGGERYGGNTFCARNLNTDGQFLFIMTEGAGGGAGVGAHFHARHTEDFYAVDGETLVWAHGQAVPIRAGDLAQAPPRNLHGFKLVQPYNRFVGFLTPGLFEPFFTRDVPGQNGVGHVKAAPWVSAASRPPAAGNGGRAFAGDRFRALMMSGRGPDGYPLDVHGPTLPLPNQDPAWITNQKTGALEQRMLLFAHAQAICGGNLSREITPDLRRALALKPKATDFV